MTTTKQTHACRRRRRRRARAGGRDSRPSSLLAEGYGAAPVRQYRVITQALLAELRRRRPGFEQCRLWEVVDALFEQALVRRDDTALRLLSYDS
jgi:hypothetical protein